MTSRVTLIPLAGALAGSALMPGAVPAAGELLAPGPQVDGASSPLRPIRELAPSRARPSRAPVRRPPGHLVVRVRRPVTLASRPGGPAESRLGSRTEFGSPRVLWAAARRGRWLGVVTSARPNGRLAWLRTPDPAIRLGRLRTVIRADLSGRTLELRREGRRVLRMKAAVGRPDSPTPTGRFAVTDKMASARYGPYYGCCILALSGHQPNPPPGWRGGTRLAIHGTNRPSTIGEAASAGCLRGADGALRALMRRAPLGTPVIVRP